MSFELSALSFFSCLKLIERDYEIIKGTIEIIKVANKIDRIPQIFNLQSTIFNSGLSGYGT
jgi:hypothetical protein